MNKGKVRKLKTMFRAKYGRNPNKSVWNVHLEVVEPNEFRQLKKLSNGQEAAAAIKEFDSRRTI